jgi:hypothetical protein
MFFYPFNQRVRVYENRVLRRILGLKRGKYKRLEEELHKCSSQIILG